MFCTRPSLATHLAATYTDIERYIFELPNNTQRGVVVYSYYCILCTGCGWLSSKLFLETNEMDDDGCGSLKSIVAMVDKNNIIIPR